ncbi:MAG: TIGR04282 family arsenosugar biosynthesis glycosyltransferase [Chloroflexi bacterium]|nr:TIGR04282 family arsenosugar biosynthesis glycosyltransferase [Chloroflexota bacterium]
MQRSVVYIVAKAPRSGAAKTRLSPMLSTDRAAEVAHGFLLDTLLLARRARGVAVRAVCRDADEARIVRALGGPSLDVLCQREPGLGAALEECFHHGLSDGYGTVAVLGSDSPTLPAAHIEQAFAALGEHDVAIGPSEDGGYYLLAARATHPTLFREMIWSTDQVCRATLERCAAAGLRATLLAEWYDVDTPACLQRLTRDLEALPADVAPHTRLTLAEIAFAPMRV